MGQIDYEGGATPRRVNGTPREPRAGPPTGEVPKGGQPPEKAGPPPGAKGGGPLENWGCPGAAFPRNRIEGVCFATNLRVL